VRSKTDLEPAYSTAVTQSACKAMEFGELGIPYR